MDGWQRYVKESRGRGDVKARAYISPHGIAFNHLAQKLLGIKHDHAYDLWFKDGFIGVTEAKDKDAGAVGRTYEGRTNRASFLAAPRVLLQAGLKLPEKQRHLTYVPYLVDKTMELRPEGAEPPTPTSEKKAFVTMDDLTPEERAAEIAKLTKVTEPFTAPHVIAPVDVSHINQKAVEVAKKNAWVTEKPTELSPADKKKEKAREQLRSWLKANVRITTQSMDSLANKLDLPLATVKQLKLEVVDEERS